jgi:hypothetical protein
VFLIFLFLILTANRGNRAAVFFHRALCGVTWRKNLTLYILWGVTNMRKSASGTFALKHLFYSQKIFGIRHPESHPKFSQRLQRVFTISGAKLY